MMPFENFQSFAFFRGMSQHYVRLSDKPLRAVAALFGQQIRGFGKRGTP